MTKVVRKVSKEESKKFWRLEFTRKMLTRSNWRAKEVNNKQVLRLGL
jgi:hypothetical protein